MPEPDSTVSPDPPSSPAPSGARFVALGIFSSKLFGLLREVIYARFLGLGAHNDVLRAALRAPNAIQNLLGEQALSASFIPVYSRLLEDGREKDAGRLAGAVFGLLLATVATLVGLGVVFAPQIVAVLSPGFVDDHVAVAAGRQSVDRYELLVRAVRILFPMTGFLVLSAWAMGVLNSHRRFFLPYVSPALWNTAILTALLGAAWRMDLLFSPSLAETGDLTRWLFAICAGALVGGALQFLVQLPLVFRLTKSLRVSLSTRVVGLRETLSAFGPALAGRGVVQLSLYLDNLLASLLAVGAVGVIQNAAVLINLPLGVFGMAVAVAELPELSRSDPETARKAIATRVDRGLRQSAFLVCPSVVGYLVFGWLVVGVLFRGGNFDAASQWLVWIVLGGYTLGLLASTTSRLLQNTFFALRDTRTPAKIASVRLLASATVGYALMTRLDQYAVVDLVPTLERQDLYFGALGLAIGSSVGAWGELMLLVYALRRRLPELRLPVATVLSRFALAVAFALPVLGLWWLVADRHLVVQAIVVLPTYAALYLGFAAWRGLPELEMWVGRLARRFVKKG